MPLMQCARTTNIASPRRQSLRCMKCGSRAHFITRHKRTCNCGSRRIQSRGEIRVLVGVKINPLTGGPWPYDRDCVPLTQAWADAEKAKRELGKSP